MAFYEPDPEGDIRCAEDNITCLSSLVSPFGADYDPNLIPGDIATGITIGNEFVEGLIQTSTSGSGSTTSTTTWYLIGEQIGHNFNITTNGGVVVEREDYLYVLAFFTASDFYCF